MEEQMEVQMESQAEQITQEQSGPDTMVDSYGNTEPDKMDVEEPEDSNVPKFIRELTSKPVLRVKNIHHELTDEDLKSLFTKVAEIEFVEFDPEDKAVAYVGFEGENKDVEKFIRESIKRFDGKKAMGKILIVEDTKKRSLLDRIKPKNFNNGRNRNGHRSNQGPRNGPRNGPRGNRPNGKPAGPRKPKRAHKTAEELDAELNDYMKQ